MTYGRTCMDLLKPVWSLKTPRCSCCNEQGALCFSTCPNCKYVVLVCDEVGSVYPNPKDLSGTARKLWTLRSFFLLFIKNGYLCQLILTFL